MKKKTARPVGEEAPLKNLGPVSLGWLREVGIENLADLKRVGALGAYQLVRSETNRASLNLLWALAGAELGIPPRELPDELKAELCRRLSEAATK